MSSTITQLLEKYPALAAGTDAECRKLLDNVQPVNYKKEDVIFRPADPCQNFMWLLEGSVRVYKHSEDGREVTLYRVNAGDLCILSLNGLMNGRSFPAEAKAETDVYGLMITGQDFKWALSHSEGFRNYLMQMMSERLSEIMTLAEEICFHPLDLRLACLLGQLFERSKGEPLDMTHITLAHELGTSREVVSRILKKLESQDCIRLSRGRIYLVSEQGLKWSNDVEKIA